MNKDIFNYTLQIPTKIMLDTDYFPYGKKYTTEEIVSEIKSIIDKL